MRTRTTSPRDPHGRQRTDPATSQDAHPDTQHPTNQNEPAETQHRTQHPRPSLTQPSTQPEPSGFPQHYDNGETTILQPRYRKHGRLNLRVRREDDGYTVRITDLDGHTERVSTDAITMDGHHFALPPGSQFAIVEPKGAQHYLAVRVEPHPYGDVLAVDLHR